MSEKELDRIDERLRVLIPELPPKASPTRDGAAAMEVLKKCAHKHIGSIDIIGYETVKDWHVSSSDTDIAGKGETLELAICAFALKLLDVADVPS